MLVMENFRKFSQIETFPTLQYIKCSRIDFYLLIFYHNGVNTFIVTQNSTVAALLLFLDVKIHP
jgi:hypothetical protein